MPSDTNASMGASMSRAEDPSRGASSLASQAQGRVSGLLRGQMEAGADYVGMVSQSAHEFARTLDEKAPELGRYMHMAADRADRFADQIRHKSPDELFDMAADYARRNPRMFFGGAIAAGFLLSRFLKSGSSSAGAYASGGDYGAGLTGGYGAGATSGGSPSSTSQSSMSSSGMSSSGMSSGAAGAQGASARGSMQGRDEPFRRDPTKEGSNA